MKTFPLILRFSLLAAILATLTGCESVYSEAPPPASPPPQTYAVLLFLSEGEEVADEQRTELISFARDTLLASGLVRPQDQLIDDPERAELLFRGRVQGGFLTEIAGVPTFNQQHMVVLTQPRRAENRIWWDAYYPFGYPSFNDDYYYSGFPYPGPGWGYPTQYRDRVNRGRGRPTGYVDHDYRDQRPRGGDNSSGGERPNRGDRNRDNVDNRPSPGPSLRGVPRNLEPADPRINRLPVVPHGPRNNTVVTRPASSPRPQPTAPSYTPPARPSAPAPTYSPPAVDRPEPSPREQYYSNPPLDIDKN